MCQKHVCLLLERFQTVCEEVLTLKSVYSETLQQIEVQKRWMAVTSDQRQNEKRNDTAGSGRCSGKKKTLVQEARKD